MPWNGSGDFSLSDTIAPATNADANELQAILTDIGTGIDASINADGQSTITGALKGADGTAALPAYSFSADLNSGFYRIGSDNVGLSLGGTKRWDFGTATSALTGALTVSTTLDVSGAATFGGDTHVITSTDTGTTAAPSLDLYRNSASPANSDFIGSIDFNGKDNGPAKQLYAQIISQITDVTAGNEDAIIILRAVIAGVLTDVIKSSATGLTGFGALAISGALSGVTTLSMAGAISGVTAPTVQRFTSGTGTYTASAGAVRVRVRMVGGGGGGGARTTNNGTAGGNTTFEAWAATGGGLGTLAGAGGTGGISGANGTGTLIIRCTGADGGVSAMQTDATGDSQAVFTGGPGGSSVFGGAGMTIATGGGAAKTNSGSGGAGGTSSTTTKGGGGGGAGEYVEFWMTAAQATGQSYAVGAAGSGGSAGGSAGGNGAAGIIIVEEYYS
jgi:hypothetical protein